MKDDDRQRIGLRGAALRFVLMVVLLVAAYLWFRDSALSEALQLERILATVEQLREAWWTPIVLIGLWALLSPLALPATPLMLAGGAIFGPWWGTLYNWIGSGLGAATTYWFARLLGHDLVAHLLGEERLTRLEQRISAYGFWSMVGLRFIPLPWPVVNFAAALSGYPFTPFLVATLVGLLPMLFVFTLFAASLVDVTGDSEQATVRFVAAVAFLGAFGVLRILIRRRGLLREESDQDSVS